MTNPEIIEWLQTAPGLKLNPDGNWGLQCVDLADSYGQAIFGVGWQECMGWVTGAREMLDAASDTYWTRTDNNPNDPHLIPKRGDVVVWGGNAANPWGHVAVVDSADPNGMWVIQQDGFAQPRVFVNGGWYSDRPAERVWVGYYHPGAGSVTGWLTARENKIVNTGAAQRLGLSPASSTPAAPLHGYQRTTVPDSVVGYRRAPNAGAELIDWLKADHTYDFKAFVRAPDGIWFVGRYSGGFSKATGFLDEGTHDLEDVTHEVFPPAPPPVVVSPSAPSFPFLNGIDVSGHNAGADLSQIQSDFCFIKASEGVGWADPHLASNVSEARSRGQVIGFYHYARPGLTEVNTAQGEADWFMECIRPHLKDGDLTALDWEAENQSWTHWAGEFADRTKAGTGSTPFIYAGTGAINAGDWTAVEAKYPLWYPNYGANEPTGYRPAAAPSHTVWASGLKIWQYTSRGSLPGYAGALDLNVFYGTRAELVAYGAKSAPPVVVPPVVEPPVVVPGNPVDDIGTLRRFFEWLTNLFMNRNK